MLLGLALQVAEMEKAVDVAEKNMTRFGLTTQEIRSRRSWVHDTQKTVSVALPQLHVHYNLSLVHSAAPWDMILTWTCS